MCQASPSDVTLDKLDMVTGVAALGQLRFDKGKPAMLCHKGDVAKRENLLTGCVLLQQATAELAHMGLSQHLINNVGRGTSPRLTELLEHLGL